MADSDMPHALLEIEGLRVEYPVPGRRRKPVSAVDDVSFTVRRGETLGLVGESGSGKSTIGNVVLGFVAASAGRVTFDGTDITRASRPERRLLARRMQVIFQDPFGSMNPALSVGDTLEEALRYNLGVSAPDRRKRVRDALDDVGLPRGSEGRYPTEFSGGQRQRIAIARALVMEPDFIVCDEAVSALDLSVQAQILNVLSRLKDEHGLSYLFVSHDLDVVEYLSDTIVVLYAGQVMERGPAEVLAANPSHPYTQALIAAAPEPDPDLQRERQERRIRVPSAGPSPTGCPFASRCPNVFARCRTERPALRQHGDAQVACHLYPDTDASATAAEPSTTPERRTK